MEQWARQGWTEQRATGDPAAHLDWPGIEAGYRALPAPPRGQGRVLGVVCRLPGEGRSVPDVLSLCPERGVIGDRWLLGSAQPEKQVAVMRADVAHLVANGQHPALSGDSLLVDLDLSVAALPAGTRLAVGRAVCEVSTEPHNGCSKFARRFGAAALKLTADPRFRAARLRGIYLTVLEAGEVGPGDGIGVVG